MDEPVTKPSHDDDNVRLLDYLLVIAKQSRMIIFTSAAVVVLVYLYHFISPDKYTATARILPPMQNLTMSAQLLDSLGGGVNPGGSALSGGLGGLASSMLGLKSPGDLYVGMMEGDTISDHIIDRFKLRELYKANNIDTARKALRNNVEIRSDRNGLISIEATDEDPQRAAAMANAFVDELDKLLQSMAIQEAKQRQAFLEKERRQASLNLTKAEEALRTFSEQNSVVQIDAQTKGMLEYIGNLRAAIDTKEVQIKVLRQEATPFNYDVIRLETELKGLKEKLHAAETQWDQACVGEVCLPTSKVPGLGLEYIRLYRELKFQEGLYQLYTKMAEIARMDMVKDIAVLQVVDRATPPEKRSNKRLLPAIKAGIGVFILIVVVAFIGDYIQNLKQRESDRKILTTMVGYLPFRDTLNRLKNLIRGRRIA